jgi:3-oxoacyl-[acyl-carrier-protein] synthase II
VVVGTGIGGLSRYDDAVEEQSRGHRRVSPLTVPMIMPSAAAAELSIRLPSRAPSLTVSGACASGSLALIHAVHMIRAGRAKVVIAGGGEGLLTQMIFGAFSRTDAMVPGTDEPPGPFDADRKGFVMGEGAGFTVLAAMDACVAAGITPVAEILGVGESTDAFHIAAPAPDGIGAALAMQAALDDAGLDGDDIGHIAAHATATPTGDVAEAAGIAATFPRIPPVTAHKGALGHLIGGAGAVSAIAAWTSAQRGLVPPVAGLRNLDPDVSLPVVADVPLVIEAGRPAMVNAFAFGGLNTSLIVR